MEPLQNINRLLCQFGNIEILHVKDSQFLKFSTEIPPTLLNNIMNLKFVQRGLSWIKIYCVVEIKVHILNHA